MVLEKMTGLIVCAGMASLLVAMISSSTRKKAPLYYNMTWKSATKCKQGIFQTQVSGREHNHEGGILYFYSSFLSAGNMQLMQNTCLQTRVYTGGYTSMRSIEDRGKDSENQAGKR